MTTPFLTSRVYLDADAYATRRLAASSVAPVYASASSYTNFCVIPSANAYRVSQPHRAICSEGDR
jgi:hypothetical protein